MPSPISTETSKKRVRGKPFTKDDPRRGKGGRPKDKHSITYWVNEFGQMTPTQAAEFCITYAKQLKEAKGDLPIFGLIAVRALMELMNDPNGSLLAQVLDRTEGKVTQPVDVFDWRAEAIKAGYDPEAIFTRLVEAGRASVDASRDDRSAPGGAADAGEPPV